MGSKPFSRPWKRKARKWDAITRVAANKQQLKGIMAAAGSYENAMQKYSEVQAGIDRIGAERLTVAQKALDQARNLMKAAGDQTKDIADKAAGALSLASTMVLIGLAVALVLGIVLAIFITRSITGPIRKIIEGLTEGAEEVASASGQVSSAAQSLAEGSTEQAASIEETSSSLEEMSSMTKQNAENASRPMA